LVKALSSGKLILGNPLGISIDVKELDLKIREPLV
jgi:hypothetical protein